MGARVSFEPSATAATINGVFRFVLLRPDDEPNDPVVLVTSTSGFDLDESITAQGFGGVLVVEPA
jgi:hypothetical protein